MKKKVGAQIFSPESVQRWPLLAHLQISEFQISPQLHMWPEIPLFQGTQQHLVRDTQECQPDLRKNMLTADRITRSSKGRHPEKKADV